jgi:D-sedoheptulose 7-phosphate isomerase
MNSIHTLAAQLLERELEELEKALLTVRDQCGESIQALAATLMHAAAEGRTIFFCGNGGSAAESQHLAAELVVRYRRNRRGISSLALTTDSSVLTACANDFAFEEIYARQVSSLGKPGDVLICLSTSGTSANIRRAAEAARSAGMGTALLTSDLFSAATTTQDNPYDLVLAAPTTSVSIAQVIHLILGHVLCDVVEQGLS